MVRRAGGFNRRTEADSEPNKPVCRGSRAGVAGGGEAAAIGPSPLFRLLWSRRARRPSSAYLASGFDSASLEGALQGLVQGGFSLFVFLLRDSALFVFDFELKDLFFQGFEQ